MELADPETLRRQIEDLQREVDALAEANIRAAELMAELDEARAVSSALQRRAEELTLQHNVDMVIAQSHGERELCTGLLKALGGTAGLELETARAAYLRADAGLERVSYEGELPEDIQRWVEQLLGNGFVEPRAKDGRWIALPLMASHGVVGALCVRSRLTPAWGDRWIGLLRSMGRAIGGAVDRLRIDAEKQRIARALERARDDALAASRAKSRFLANMSHELRTPLNAIIGYSEMLRDDAEDDELEHYVADLDKIVRSGRHLLSLISEILDLSKIEAGKMELHVSSFGVRTMIDDVVATARALTDRNNNELRLELDADMGQAVGDEAKIRQCLLNLLSNAAKFTEDGVVSLVARRAGEQLRFVVQDTGIGMRPDELAKIFDVFTQADSSPTRKFGGTGLGLAITRRLCQLMHGDISVHSRVGVGTSFEIILPARLPLEG